MIRWLSLVWFMALVSSCVTTRSTPKVEQSIPETRQYELLVMFASKEDVKRVPHRFSNLKMSLLEEVSMSDNIYRVSIECENRAIEGTIVKLNMEAGITWGKRSG